MKTYEVLLKSPVSNSFRCQKAANSLDIDTEKKSIHHLKIDADLNTDFNVGLIIGASGSGKTTLAHQIFGDDIYTTNLKENIPIIEQFPENMTYDECAILLNGVGLTSVPCWIRPVYTLSNGQKSRAEIALLLANDKKEILAVDEWTSVVDRTVAKVMSHCVQKMARRNNKKVVLNSCHYDVLEWLNPCWVIDCNKQTYIDRRLLWQSFERKEKLKFEIRKAERKTWGMFSKYHYLSDKLPGGHIETFGLFLGQEQIGFQCFANYVPHRDKAKRRVMHSNRTVVHPDYAGLGLGIKIINETSAIMAKEYEVMAKFSSTPIYKAFLYHPNIWKLANIERSIKNRAGKYFDGGRCQRLKVKTYSFKYIGEAA